MARDRPLSRDFVLREFPGWEQATEEQADRAEELARTILQPARRVWGPIVVTSWLRSHGAHATGGAVDAVPILAHQENPERGVELVHGWIATYHPGAYGELLYELAGPGESTPHIHVTLPGIGGQGETLRQVGWTSDGKPRWELGYLVPSLLPVLLAGAALLWLIVAAAGGAGGGGG